MEQELMLAAVANNAPGMITVYNIKTYQYLYVNKTITKILGYQPEDFINGGVEFAISLVHRNTSLLLLLRFWRNSANKVSATSL